MSPSKVKSIRLAVPELERRATACVRTTFPGAHIGRVEELQGGASSLTYVGRVDGAPVDRAVIKVAPAGLPPIRNRDLLRQAWLFSALVEAEGVLVPLVYGTDLGDPPEYPPLFVMSHVDGDSFEPLTGASGPGPGPKAVEQRGLAAARMLARLHIFDFQTSELARERASSLLDEVDRWSKALATCEDDLHPAAIDEIDALLRASPPTGWRPAITHGDYRLGNMLSVGDQIRAVIDWEICRSPTQGSISGGS